MSPLDGLRRFADDTVCASVAIGILPVSFFDLDRFAFIVVDVMLFCVVDALFLMSLVLLIGVVLRIVFDAIAIVSFFGVGAFVVLF